MNKEQMKKTILLLLTFVSTFVGLNAQELTATLQQNGTTTVYYGSNALNTACNEAEAGAVITLSAGSFTGTVVTKQVSIVGNSGENSDNGTRIQTYKKVGNNYYSLIINADDVKIEGVYAQRVCLASEKRINNCHIRHCQIDYLRSASSTNGHWGHDNTIIDQSIVGTDSAFYASENCCYKNSFIKEFISGYSYQKDIYMTNCLVERYEYNDYAFYTDQSSSPRGTYKNCILGSFYRQSSSIYYHGGNAKSLFFEIGGSNGYLYINPYLMGTSHYYKCLFYIYPFSYVNGYFSIEESLKTQEMAFDGSYDTENILMSTYSALFDSDGNLKKTLNSSFKGDDGKVIGPYGGEGFTLIPSIPRITQSTIDSYTNGEGKLNAKIKVEVNP